MLVGQEQTGKFFMIPSFIRAGQGLRVYLVASPLRTILQSPPRPCSTCRQPTYRAGKCERHYRQAEHRRGSSHRRGYGPDHRDRFRSTVLSPYSRHPLHSDVCVIDDCTAASTVADHYPRTRRQLERLGLDPNDPRYGRALCEHHHNQHTRRTS